MAIIPLDAPAIPQVPFVTTFVTAHPIITSVVAILLLLYIYCYPYTEYTLAYRNVPGPPSSSVLFGNLPDIVHDQTVPAPMQWFRQYGTTIRYSYFLGAHRFTTTDARAVEFIAQHTDLFVRPPQLSRVLGWAFGHGILTVEGEAHKRQRRVLNPAFGAKAVRGMMPIFWECAYALSQKLDGFLDSSNDVVTCPSPPVPVDRVPGARKIDVLKYLGQATLDINGRAGFDYEFGSLEERPNALAESFNSIWTEMKVTIVAILIDCYAEKLPLREIRLIEHYRGKTRAIADDIVQRKKRDLQAEFTEKMDRKTKMGDDLVTLLLRANMVPDLPASQKLSDEEVRDQITNFILAGNETSATALAWGLMRLAQNLRVQHKLREELMAVTEDHLDYDELMALPYLDKVTREILRLDPPVPGAPRMAAADVVVPLATPIRGRNGKMMDHVKLRKGDQLVASMIEVNRSKELWGEDADEFKPERYDKEHPTTLKVPGVWGNVMTFMGGPHNCLGYRFALAMIKSILFVLIRNFEFEELPSKPVFLYKIGVVLRPYVEGEESAGLQMPLLVRPVQQAE